MESKCKKSLSLPKDIDWVPFSSLNSPVWGPDRFHKAKSRPKAAKADKGKLAYCPPCNDWFSCQTGLTQLKRHLRDKHKIDVDKAGGSATTCSTMRCRPVVGATDSAASASQPLRHARQTNTAKQLAFEISLARWFAASLRPISLCEDDAFRNMVT